MTVALWLPAEPDSTRYGGDTVHGAVPTLSGLMTPEATVISQFTN